VIACNTSSSQYFVVETSCSIPPDTNLFRTETLLNENPSLNFSIRSVFSALWGEVGEGLLTSNISTLSLQYQENGSLNSIGTGHWQLVLTTAVGNEEYEYQADSARSADLISGQDLEPLNAMWNLTGATFEVLYWLYLADFGQISPTVYPSSCRISFPFSC
jgi:hypothetical protein